MEIYADETNERVFVGDGRGPYTVVERDGSTSESFIPRGAVPVAVGDVAERSYDDGYDDGFSGGGRDQGVMSANVRRMYDDCPGSGKTRRRLQRGPYRRFSTLGVRRQSCIAAR
jgi:hypothetical protein